MRLEHGEHNEELCDFIFNNTENKYNDWVVTTAFYACIHFVEHKIFPCKIGGIEFSKFEDYCDKEHNENNNSNSKHSLKVQLVKKRIPGINAQYRWLKDACMNARYVNYKISSDKAKSANVTMKKIKEACIG